jgi:hypothetical protein
MSLGSAWLPRGPWKLTSTGSIPVDSTFSGRRVNSLTEFPPTIQPGPMVARARSTPMCYAVLI